MPPYPSISGLSLSHAQVRMRDIILQHLPSKLIPYQRVGARTQELQHTTETSAAHLFLPIRFEYNSPVLYGLIKQYKPFIFSVYDSGFNIHIFIIVII